MTVDCLDPTRYSSRTRLTRVFGTVNRFLKNCRLPSTLCKKAALGPEEIVTSEMHFIRLAQQEEFQEEIQALKSGKGLPGNSKLLPLKPLLDEGGVHHMVHPLSCCVGLGTSMIWRALPAGAYAPGRATHAGRVKG